MNRQIVPSMLLSVLIVCFFAVILFERDSPRRSGGNDRAASGKKAGAERVAPPVHETATAKAPESPPPADGKQKPEEKPKSEPRTQVSGTSSSTSGSPSPAHPPVPPAAQDPPVSKSQVVTQPPASQTAGPTPPPARAGATRGVDSAQKERPPVKKASAEPGVESGPKQAFTAVRQGETLRDVATRVYGSADELDSLWRANRDVLPRQDSPLAAGSVLRTPAITRGD